MMNPNPSPARLQALVGFVILSFLLGCGNSDRPRGRSLPSADGGAADAGGGDAGSRPSVDAGVADAGADSGARGDDAGSQPTTEVRCGDGLDDDADGLVDCRDPDCSLAVGCGGVCGDGVLDELEACDPGRDGSGCCTDGCHIASAGTVCRTGTGDACDPDERCDGESARCPDDVVGAAGSPCREGSGDVCNPSETCSGLPGEACPVDAVAIRGTVCRESVGECDAEEACTGMPGEGCPADAAAEDGTPCGDSSESDCSGPDQCSLGVCAPNDALAGVACGDALTEPSCDPDVCDGEGGCTDVPALADGSSCSEHGGDTCCGGGCREGTPAAGMCDACALPALPPLTVYITEPSAGGEADHWRDVAVAAGHSASLVDVFTLSDLSNLDGVDVLVISSHTQSLTASQMDTLEAFVRSGRGAYIQGEYLQSFEGNVRFSSLVTRLGGSFTWAGQVRGDLAPFPVSGCLGTSPEAVEPMSYFWYGCRGTGAGGTWDYFLMSGGSPVGYSFCPPDHSHGMVIHMTDSDFLRTTTPVPVPEADALMRNIIARLAFADRC